MPKKHKPGKNQRLREKKRKARATQALLSGVPAATEPGSVYPADPAEPLAGLTKANRFRVKRNVRKFTRRQLNELDIRTQVQTVVMKNEMDKAIDENKDWRLRVETVNAGFRENQSVGLRLGLENMERVARGHNALEEHVRWDAQQTTAKMEIVDAKLELVGEDVGELREQNKALREKNAKLETDLESMLGSLSALQSEVQQLRNCGFDGKSGKQQCGGNQEGWKGRLRSRKKA
ncbi:hypothetical protein CGCS363_v001708 [Colletotrichum siamense]|uniref:uncharacterized protein n=1 Tax=Colletotrichum siamense TaxID=690259 RepID=UPI001872F875|nr:uncharacterized protein CGCS363_v001708 [Colletotrichum siamense]KAF5516011.1 hypothetical protein CGCS363_v001708 [Colletotrichum siamense]